MSDPEPLAEESRSIVVETRAVPLLTPAEREQLFQLMAGHFENVDAAHFFADLDEKRVVILISDPALGRFVGFATLGVLQTTVDGEPVAAVFAGDTVIEPPYWGQHAWIRVWSRQAFELVATVPFSPVYFLLLTSTQRSYRFLPGFFREYYPRPDHAMPSELRARRDALVHLKFAKEFDAERGVVSLLDPTPVRIDRVDPATTASENADARFFLQLNPGFLRGDFLVCFTEYSWDNMTPLGRRVSS